AVWPLGCGVAGTGGERVRVGGERREVDDAVDDRGGAGDRRACREPPAELARPAVEGIELVVVGADQDEAAPDGRRGVDVPAGAETPEQVTIPGRERVDVTVDRTGVDAA